MTDEDRKLLRAQVAGPIVAVQNKLRERGVPAEVVVPEIVNALLSLAALIAKDNAQIERDEFHAHCVIASAKIYGE